MRLPVLLIAAFVLLVMEVSLRHVLAFGGWSPSFLTCLMVFIALFAPRTVAIWVCWGLGVAVDLVTPRADGALGAMYLIGPHALGFAAAGWAVVMVRSMMFRRRALSIGALTFGAVLVISAVVLGIAAVRTLYTGPGLSSVMSQPTVWREIGHRLGLAGYSALLAIPLGWVLVRTLPLWQFAGAGHRRSWR